MKKTNWQKIMKAVMSAKPAMTYLAISSKTGVCISTLSRLATQKGRQLDYDSGVKLMSLHDELINKGKLK